MFHAFQNSSLNNLFPFQSKSCQSHSGIHLKSWTSYFFPPGKGGGRSCPRAPGANCSSCSSIGVGGSFRIRLMIGSDWKCGLYSHMSFEIYLNLNYPTCPLARKILDHSDEPDCFWCVARHQSKRRDSWGTRVLSPWEPWLEQKASALQMCSYCFTSQTTLPLRRERDQRTNSFIDLLWFIGV